ncbi:MAG: hypothetical protein QW585_01525 [Candidatus Pacearchaeota archaeon]
MKLVTFIIFLAFLFIAISGLNCEKQTRWEKVENGRWKATNLSCIERNPLAYLCIENCYEKSYSEIWDFCKEKGKIKRTNTGIEVLCFASSCVPEVSNDCKVFCPVS